MLTAQSFFGSASDFYEYRFIIKRDIDPDDLASFYGGEEFMEIFCMMPIIGEMMMRGGYFDDEGIVHTYGFPGELLVSMAFTDEEDDEGKAAWFNKRERFKDVCFGTKMWDQVSNFGFHTLPDGKLEVYHTGEYFVGRLPIVSLIVKLAFQIQGRWVAWATEHYLNHHAFTAETEEEAEIEELCRTNHPLYLLKYHVWEDTKAMLGFGSKKLREEDASFLSVGTDGYVGRMDLPIQRLETRRKIQDDLAIDKEFQVHSKKDDLPEHMSAYAMAQKSAMQRHMTLRVLRRKTTRKRFEGLNENVSADSPMLEAKEESTADSSNLIMPVANGSPTM